MYLSDSRGGSIRIDSLDARVDGVRTGLDGRQAYFLVEQEEDALYLRSTLKIPTLFPTHGPASIRVLADYEEQLRNRNVVILYRNDIVGHKFAHFGGRILERFAKPRLLPVNQYVRDWIRAHSHHEIRKALPKPLRTGELSHAHDDWLVITGVRQMEDCAGVWSEMDDPPVLDLLAEQKLSFVYLDDARLPMEYRVRLIPARRKEESLDNYAKRTGY